MTREEEIKNIALCYAHDELKDNHGDVEDVVAAAFIDGANYADAHPHWVSVEDELPPYNKNVLVYDAEHPYFEFWWARRYAKGSGRLLDKNGFTTLTDDVNVTHWMYINPPITNPNLEDNSKKGGEE